MAPELRDVPPDRVPDLQLHRAEQRRASGRIGRRHDVEHALLLRRRLRPLPLRDRQHHQRLHLHRHLHLPGQRDDQADRLHLAHLLRPHAQDVRRPRQPLQGQQDLVLGGVRRVVLQLGLHRLLAEQRGEHEHRRHEGRREPQRHPLHQQPAVRALQAQPHHGGPRDRARRDLPDRLELPPGRRLPVSRGGTTACASAWRSSTPTPTRPAAT